MSDTSIARVVAYEALDSRGRPTVGCVVRLADGAEGHAIVPSGASTGSHEALELRDGGARYGGRGVRRAVANVNGALAWAVQGLDAADQAGLDHALRAADGTPSLDRLGANAVLGVSLAAAIATAASRRLPLWRSLAPEASSPLLPMPMVNVVSGGAHAAGAIDIQDVLVVPVGAASFSEAIEWASRVRAGTAGELDARGHATSLVADEGGLAAPFTSNREAIEVVVRGIERAGLAPGDEAAIALDVAATELGDAERGYRLASEGRTLETGELVAEVRAWADAFPIVSIEDPLGEDDPLWPGLTHVLGGRLQLVGDDRFVTSAERLRDGVAGGVGNAVLVKPNQCGTVSEALEVVRLAQEAGYATVVSARSGETEDAWLSDLAVGWRAGQIKVGSTQRSERTAKWNRLLRIEAEAADAVFAGRAALAPPR